MINPRMRMTALAGGMALSMSLALAPAAMAQDGPEATFDDFVAAFEDLDLAALPTFFCADQAEVLGGLGLANMTAGMPPGFDFMLDAIDITMDVETLDVLSQSETEAIIDVSATMTTTFDAEAIMPMLVEMLEGLGASEADIAQMQEEMLAELPEAETATIAGQITLVPGESRPWVICSDLQSLNGDVGDGMGDMAEDDMAEDDMAEDDMAEDDMAEGDMADDDMAEDDMADEDGE